MECWIKKRLSLFPLSTSGANSGDGTTYTGFKILISAAISVENDGTWSWHVLGLDESKQEIRQNSHSVTERLHRSAEIVLNRAKLMTVTVKMVLNQTTKCPVK